jgi:hypothetical protein
MKRRINFSGRKKISADDIKIRVSEPASGQAPTFTVDLTMPSGLPKDARVYIEPYQRSTSMRFDFGTVGVVSPPADLRLTEVDYSSGILFRVKVVNETDDVGKIIAASSRIRPLSKDEDPGVKALLPLVSKNLGEEVWRLFMEGAAPVLEINNRIPGLRDRLLSDRLLQGAVFPHALTILLQNLLGTDEHDDDEQWVKDWTGFAERLNGEELPDNLSDPENEVQLASTIENIVGRFCQMNAFASNVRKETEQAYCE